MNNLIAALVRLEPCAKEATAPPVGFAELVRFQREAVSFCAPARLAALRQAAADFKTAFEIIKAAPELNSSNYDHDEVCELNSKVCEAYGIMRAAIETLNVAFAEKP